METEDILYKEIVETRKEMRVLREELSSFKLKVYAMALSLGGAGGIATKLFSIL